MELLISKGVDVESQSDAGTPLIWAAGHSQPEPVKLLLKHNANVSVLYDGKSPILTRLGKHQKYLILSFFSYLQKVLSC
jgi:ankyrin repeat protein